MGESKVWICVECGREFDSLPFPASCKCGNWCEDYFREKDHHDYEDDKLGQPLLGVKYDPKVLAQRNKKLKVSQKIVMKVDKKEKPIKIKPSKKKQRKKVKE